MRANLSLYFIEQTYLKVLNESPIGDEFSTAT